jgi:hypothetical protein
MWRLTILIITYGCAVLYRQGQLAPQKITSWHVAARINPQGKEVTEWENTQPPNQMIAMLKI